MGRYESEDNKNMYILLLWYNAIDELFIVIPRCCSSRLLSMYLNFPTIFWDITPLLATRESAIVVLPWSTWAIMQILRIESGLCWSSISLFWVRSAILTVFSALKRIRIVIFERKFSGPTRWFATICSRPN